MTILEKNYERIAELLPEKQWAVREGMERCWNLNKQFKILEVYRTPERQHALWQKDRDANGKLLNPKKNATNCDGYIVKSNHQLRLAFDILPIRCAYKEIEDILAEFGITHPHTTRPFVDLPHFEVIKVGPRPLRLSPEAKRKQLEARIERLDEPRRSRAKQRLDARLNSSPPSL